MLLPISAMLVLPLAAERSNETAKLRIAASQYEIISVLMKNQEYSRVPDEFRKILDLNLSTENEKPLVQATFQVVDGLRQAGQYSTATQIADEALNKLKLSESKYFLMMAKGKVLKDQGRFQEAIEIYRKAQAFAPSGLAPEK